MGNTEFCTSKRDTPDIEIKFTPIPLQASGEFCFELQRKFKIFEEVRESLYEKMFQSIKLSGCSALKNSPDTQFEESIRVLFFVLSSYSQGKIQNSGV
mmetsp:Transcript_15101/g.12816  ORF Transcript_15101/g.12816 Transcript_15101/m.12816 type:complete len:98 (+) Transcript_15101:63-356(+)